MTRKIVFALLLILNHSLLLGEIQAAEMPDSEHPFGHESPLDHLVEFSLEEHLLHEHHVDGGEHDCEQVHPSHQDHHEHGMHIHLSLALADSLLLDSVPAPRAPQVPYLLTHKNQTYTPPVPPPIR
ncbi:MAG: hypothetical protein KDI28_02815 [Pseudomonadales bacterium]|nr:hypothetical protein [Pseudomonadales bacterium]MCP5358487.1 hypothetical protein [Pseudomonadales bacterium]